MEITRQQTYENLLLQISATYTEGQQKAMRSVNVTLLETYWQIGPHYIELMKIGLDFQRQFYEKQSLLENWSIRELKRQKNAA